MSSLSAWAFRDLSYIVSDKELMMSLLEQDEKPLAKYITVNKDGSLTIGKTPYRWINKLFGSERIINPETLCLRLIEIITGHGGGRNEDAYYDLCKRFSEYYKDGNYSLAISTIFTVYRFVLAPDIKTLTNCNSSNDGMNKNNNKVLSGGIETKTTNVTINGVIIKDGHEQAVVVDFNNPRQVLFRRM